MECIVCGIRSSTTSCVECQALLCEECAAVCESCGKSACPDHVHDSRSGRRMCEVCYEERKARKRKRKGGAAPTHKTLEAPDGDAAVGDEELEDQTLTASGRARVQPWKMALYISLCALAIALILMVPAIRRVPLGANAYLPTHIVPILMAAVAVGWAIYGMYTQRYFDERAKCIISVGVAVVIVAISAVGIVTDPARQEARDARALEDVRGDMSQDELEDWRDGVLDRYER